MPRINYLCAVVLWFFLTCCFSYGEVSSGINVNFTVPKNYDPTKTLSLAQYKEGELLVRFAPKDGNVQTTLYERNTILAGLGGGDIKETYKMVPGLSLIKLPENVKVEEVLGNFNKSAGILYSQPNYVLKAISTFPNDPNFNKLWGMHNTGQTGGMLDADIDAPEAWEITTNSDIIVAVIDSGVDYNHPDLAANMWHNPGEIPGNGIDDDNNGYIDDIYGYDFCTFQGKQRDSDPIDDAGHGTHCAGIIGAIGNNGVGVTGSCWNVKIMPVRFPSFLTIFYKFK